MKKIDDKDEEKNIDKQVESMNKIFEDMKNDPNLTEEEKKELEELENVVKFINKQCPNSKKEKIISFIKKLFRDIILYFIVYLAFFGLLGSKMIVDNKYYVFAYIALLTIYQILFRRLLSIKVNSIVRNKIYYVMFLIISIILQYYLLDTINLIKFSNLGYLILYYIGSELIVLLCKYYISKYTFNKLLR